MKQFITGPAVPTAQICINKSRLKIHNKDKEPTYYLKSGQEFQMEFYNPTSDTILAKIYLNGKAISQGGLVLRPAERVFLTRYLDVAKKFLFETYEVANTKEAQKAIESNGDFKVEFFRESIPYNNWYGTNTINISNGNYWPSTLTFTNTSGSGILRGSLSTTSFNTNSSDLMNVKVSNSAQNALYNDSLDFSPESEQLLADSYKNLRSVKKKSIETGRVEMGGQSSQQLKTVDKTFHSWPFHTVEYRLLPISQKVNTSSDVNVAVYCTNCGQKARKTDKFCASCGVRI